MFDKEALIGILSAIYGMLDKTEDYDKAVEALNAIKINSLVNYYINATQEYNDQDKIIIPGIIRLLQDIDNNSGVISPISNEDYDKLYELNKIVNDEDIIGAPIQGGRDKNILNHKYPDLRGTLDKVHFVTIKDRNGDNRKSIEDWKNSVENRLGRPLIGDEKYVWLFPKWDGLSVIFECDADGVVQRCMSRGDTEKNEAVDLTPLFKGTKFDHKEISEFIPFGVKTEVIMSWDNYYKLCEKEGEFKSPRSAVSSILNSKELDKKYLQYLTVVPLQKQQNGGNVIIAKECFDQYPYATIKIDDYEKIEECIALIKKDVDENYKMNIDGIVVRFISPDLQEKLGRDGAINKFDVAYKFPPERKKTILLDVEFQVGLMGAITPVAKVKPVKMKGNTIKSITFGSVDRFESLAPRQGSEVIIKYDVIPYIDIDETCDKGNGEEFTTIRKCPYCDDVLLKDPVLKCVNLNCESRMVGKILNYVEKMRIANISIGIITTLFKAGYLKSIEDIYELEKHKRSIVQMEGFGEKSFEKIIEGRDARREVFDYEMIGSIGIPDMGRKIFKKILNIYYLDELIDICVNEDVNKLTNIGGIKDKTANRIIKGVQTNLELIKFLCSELDVKRDERKYTIKVCFTKVRDKDFEKFLEDKGVLVLEDYKKEVDIIIIPDNNTESGKITKARKDGKEILTIQDAYKVFGYKK